MKKENTLRAKLEEYSESGMYPFHMPGHKRNLDGMPSWNPWKIDMTEVEGTDNLHHADGILQEAMARAARLAGADRSWFLVNGSTGGILSAVAAVVKPGDTVLVARNCHKSVYHAIALNHLRAVYVQPEWIESYRMAGGIDPKKIRHLLAENPQIKAAILTSPTYEGIVSDIEQIAEIVHERGIPLIVDEAHGAHFNQAGFPVSAVRLGADIVVQSTHKTLPALTQTGLLHIKGELADQARLQEFLAIYQTSSPSYVLMASIDDALSFLEHEQAAMLAYGAKLSEVREKINSLVNIHAPGKELVGKAAVYDVDNSKLILAVCGKTPDSKRENGKIRNAKALYELLRTKYHLQCEMTMECYVLAMTSVKDTDEGYERLLRALREADADIAYKYANEQEMSESQAADRQEQGAVQNKQSTAQQENYADMPKPGEAVLTITEAFYAEKESCVRTGAAGRISGEYLYLYPPGIPYLVPGERISGELLEHMEELEKEGFEIQGLSDESKTDILVVKEDQ